VFASDAYLAAIDLLLAIQADGSLMPGTLSLTEREAMENLPRGTAAMILDGPWVISRLAEQAPDFQYGLGSQPLASDETFMPLGYAPGGANYHFVSTTSDLQQVAGDVLAYWGSVAGQSAFQSIVGGALLAIIPEAQESARMDEASTRAMVLFEEQMRLHPDPRARNPDIGKVYLEYRRLQPNFGETIQGILSGQIADTKAAMEDLANRAGHELERAITAAQEKGAQVSRDDFVFANWDPSVDYTDEQYGELAVQ
jgi:multiple sugar transport system substrate-binding protein